MATGEGKLPRDVVAEILVLCSLEDVSRFRLVSPYFRTLIESNGFAKKHMKVSMEMRRGYSVMLLRERPHFLNRMNVDYRLSSIDLYPLSPQASGIAHPISYNLPGRTKMVGSVNGIVCLVYGLMLGSPCDGQEEGDLILLWNPATKKHLILPHPISFHQNPGPYQIIPTNDSDPSQEGIYDGHIDIVWSDEQSVVLGSSDENTDFSVDDVVSLASDDVVSLASDPEDLLETPYVNTLGLGFGYDSTRDDYIILRIVAYDNVGESYITYRAQAQLYSFSSNSWTRIETPPHYTNFFEIPVFCSGRFHWVVSEDHLANGSAPGCVLALDIRTRLYNMMTLPNYLRPTGIYKLFVAEIGGCLFLLYNSGDNIFDMWVMREYGDATSWTKLLSISQMFHMIPEIYNRFTPLAYSQTLDEILMSLNGKKLFWFNQLARTMEYADIVGLPRCFSHVVYVKSLVSLGANAVDDDEQAGGS